MQYEKYHIVSTPHTETAGNWYNVIYDKDPGEHPDAKEIGNFIVKASEVEAAGSLEAVIKKTIAIVFATNDIPVIGECIEIQGKKYYLKGPTDEGYVYKDYDAFENHPDKVCYVPEYADEVEIGEFSGVPADSRNCYTKTMLLALCEGNEELCGSLFESLDWSYPETKLEDWDNNGTLDEFKQQANAEPA